MQLLCIYAYIYNTYKPHTTHNILYDDDDDDNSNNIINNHSLDGGWCGSREGGFAGDSAIIKYLQKKKNPFCEHWHPIRPNHNGSTRQTLRLAATGFSFAGFCRFGNIVILCTHSHAHTRVYTFTSQRILLYRCTMYICILLLLLLWDSQWR